MHTPPSRRDFLKLAGLGLGSLAFRPPAHDSVMGLPQFPAGDRLGRVAVYPNAYSTELKSLPDENAAGIRPAPQDEVVTWVRDIVGTSVAGRTNRRWAQVHTADGYDGFIYAADMQPVRNVPNSPLTILPEGKPGFWTEITVPYVDLQLAGPAIGAGVKDLLQYNQPIRLYYGQVAWIDEVRQVGDGSIFYRFNEAPQRGYGPGDLLIGEAAAFHVLTEEDVAPINPNVDPASKRITVDATPGHQTLSCFEGNTEVFYCRVSTGFVGQVTDYSTPGGEQATAWKILSLHMGANLPASGSGYDTMAVPWAVFFNTNAGAAIHGTFWHNDFGVRRSHGCVNVSPEDAKWIFRWTTPAVTLDQSELRLTWPDVGGSFSTAVIVDDFSTTA
jgi:hypothetical protein